MTGMEAKLCGVLNIYKPLGITSFDVVRKVKWTAKEKKVGHGGTLDPEASGVLPVCIGRATKAIDFIMSNEKQYIAEVKLGTITDTYDREGKIIEENEVACTEEEVREAVMSFVGDIMQIPPMYSALKVNGKKLYELAREGKEIPREARKISIGSIEILDISLPVVKIRVNCSKGTYIRSLCYDIGQKLGCGGMMLSLERTATGPFTMENSVKLEELTPENIRGYIIPLEEVFADYPRLVVNPKFERLVTNGVNIKDRAIMSMVQSGTNYAVYNEEKKFIGIGAAEKDCFKLIKLFI